MKHRTLAQMVRGAREDRGLTQEQMAELTGISRSTIANIESGDTKFPTKRTLAKLEAKMGLSRQDMLRGAGQLDMREDVDIMAEFRRIRGIRDLNDQMAALDDLPDEAFEIVEVMAHRLLQDRLRIPERPETA